MYHFHVEGENELHETFQPGSECAPDHFGIHGRIYVCSACSLSYVQSLVCVMCSLQSLLCAVSSLCDVQSLVCVMCSLWFMLCVVYIYIYDSWLFMIIYMYIYVSLVIYIIIYIYIWFFVIYMIIYMILCYIYI